MLLALEREAQRLSERLGMPTKRSKRDEGGDPRLVNDRNNAAEELATNRPHMWKPSIADTTMEIIVLKQRYAKWPLAIEVEWNAEFGSLGKGKSIPVEMDSPAEGSGNEIDKVMGKPRPGGKWSKGRRTG